MEKKLFVYAIGILAIAFFFSTYITTPAETTLTGNAFQDEEIQGGQLYCNLNDQTVPGTQASNNEIKSVDTYENIVAYRRNGAGNAGVWIYDLGQNLRLDLDANGNPSGDDRGPFQIFADSSVVGVVDVSVPSVYGTKIVYSYTTFLFPDTYANVFVEVYDIGQDKIGGTSDDTKKQVYAKRVQCDPFGNPCDPVVRQNVPFLFPKIRGDILSWYERSKDNIPPYSILSTVYWCDLVNKNSPDYCDIGLNTIFTNRKAAVFSLFISRVNAQNNIDAVWLEGGTTHVLTNNVESVPYQQQQFSILDFLSASGFYSFDQYGGSGRETYVAPINNPSSIIPLTQHLTEPRLSQTTFTSTKNARDPGLFVGLDPLIGNSLKVARITPSITSIAVPDTKSVYFIGVDSYAVYGNNILFVEQGAYGSSALKYTRCYGN